MSNVNNNAEGDVLLDDSEVRHPLFDYTKVSKGTEFFATTDIDVVVSLITLGFQVRKDPCATRTRNPDGKEIITVYFNTTSDCGQFTAKAFMEAYKNDAKFVNENRDNPLSYVIASLKNRASVKRALGQLTPIVCMRSSTNKGPVIQVHEGSEKYRNCLAKGMIHVNRDCIFNIR